MKIFFFKKLNFFFFAGNPGPLASIKYFAEYVLSPRVGPETYLKKKSLKELWGKEVLGPWITLLERAMREGYARAQDYLAWKSYEGRRCQGLVWIYSRSWMSQTIFTSRRWTFLAPTPSLQIFKFKIIKKSIFIRDMHAFFVYQRNVSWIMVSFREVNDQQTNEFYRSQ